MADDARGHGFFDAQSNHHGLADCYSDLLQFTREQRATNGGIAGVSALITRLPPRPPIPLMKWYVNPTGVEITPRGLYNSG